MYVCIYTYVSIPLDDSRIDTRASPAERDGERKKGRVKWCETASERVERECAWASELASERENERERARERERSSGRVFVPRERWARVRCISIWKKGRKEGRKKERKKERERHRWVAEMLFMVWQNETVTVLFAASRTGSRQSRDQAASKVAKACVRAKERIWRGNDDEHRGVGTHTEKRVRHKTLNMGQSWRTAGSNTVTLFCWLYPSSCFPPQI